MPAFGLLSGGPSSGGREDVVSRSGIPAEAGPSSAASAWAPPAQVDTSLDHIPHRGQQSSLILRRHAALAVAAGSAQPGGCSSVLLPAPPHGAAGVQVRAKIALRLDPFELYSYMGSTFSLDFLTDYPPSLT